MMPRIFFNQLLSMDSARSLPHFFFSFFFPEEGTHNCTLLFWDLSPEEDLLLLDTLDFPHGVLFCFVSF